MAQQQQQSDFVTALSSIVMEIEKLNFQIKPAMDKIKELRKLRKELEKQLEPVMSESGINYQHAPGIDIEYQQNATKIPPFKEELVAKVAQMYFQARNVAHVVSGDELMQFIQDYRKKNPVAKDSGIKVTTNKPFVNCNVLSQVSAIDLQQLGHRM